MYDLLSKALAHASGLIAPAIAISVILDLTLLALRYRGAQQMSRIKAALVPHTILAVGAGAIFAIVYGATAAAVGMYAGKVVALTVLAIVICTLHLVGHLRKAAI